MTNLEEILSMDGPLPANLCEMWEHWFSVEGTWTGLVNPSLFDCDLFPLQRKQELALMLAMADLHVRPKTVMSIGCDKGSELYHWCCLSKVERVIACEIRGVPYSGLFERTFPHIKFLWLPCSSYEDGTKTAVASWLGQTDIDVLFIDGDKSHFLIDFDLYKDLVSPNGIVFMHDITDPAPGEAYRTVRQRGYNCFDLIDTTEAVELFDREPRTGYEAWLKLWGGRSCGIGCIRVGRKS